MADPYQEPSPPTHADVLMACEVLLRAGHTMEALSVLHALMPEELRELVRQKLVERDA